MKLRSLASTTIFVAACSPASPAPAPPPKPLAIPPAPSDGGSTVPAPAVSGPSPKPIERPAASGCAFEGERADVAITAITKATESMGMPWVSHRKARAKVSLGGDMAWIEFETRDVKVAGRAFPEHVWIHPKAPMRFDDVAWLGAHTTLPPKSKDAAHVELELRYGDAQRRRATFACADLAFGSGPKGSPSDLVPGWAQAKPVVVLARPTTPLTETADGAPVSAFERGRAARQLETKTGKTRIAWDFEGAILTGWVPSSAIAPNGTPIEGRVVTIEDTNSVNPQEEESPPSAAASPRTVCSHEVRLAGVVRELDAWLFGVVKANVPLATKNDAPKAGYVRVARGLLDLTVHPDTELVIPKSDLADCTEK